MIDRYLYARAALAAAARNRVGAADGTRTTKEGAR